MEPDRQYHATVEVKVACRVGQPKASPHANRTDHPARVQAAIIDQLFEKLMLAVRKAAEDFHGRPRPHIPEEALLVIELSLSDKQGESTQFSTHRITWEQLIGILKQSR